jgi:hypothetical protein
VPPIGEDVSGTFAFGDPIHTPHAQLLLVRLNVSPRWQLPMTTKPSMKGVLISYEAVLSTVNGIHVAPPFGLPASVTIGNMAFDADQMLGTRSPVIAWTAPQGTVTPNGYTVEVVRLYDMGVTKSQVVASLTTSETSLELPPGVLKSGEKYGLFLIATYYGVAPTMTPEKPSLPHYQTAVHSGILTAP